MFHIRKQQLLVMTTIVILHHYDQQLLYFYCFAYYGNLGSFFSQNNASLWISNEFYWMSFLAMNLLICQIHVQYAKIELGKMICHVHVSNSDCTTTSNTGGEYYIHVYFKTQLWPLENCNIIQLKIKTHYLGNLGSIVTLTNWGGCQFIFKEIEFVDFWK